jgi:hypothetical protein
MRDNQGRNNHEDLVEKGRKPGDVATHSKKKEQHKKRGAWGRLLAW